MAITTTMESAAPTIAGATRTRILGVAGAAAAAVAVWAIAVPLLGVQLLVKFGSGAPQSIGIGFVLGASLIGSLAGWGLLVLLERRTPQARTIWTAIAVLAVLVSFSLPLFAGVSTSTKVTLAVMHVAVAAVLIPVMRRGSRAQLAS
jgi:predicted permease